MASEKETPKEEREESTSEKKAEKEMIGQEIHINTSEKGGGKVV